MNYMTWLKIRKSIQGSWFLIALFVFLVGLSLKDGISFKDSLAELWPLGALLLVYIMINYFKLSK